MLFGVVRCVDWLLLVGWLSRVCVNVHVLNCWLIVCDCVRLRVCWLCLNVV